MSSKQTESNNLLLHLRYDFPFDELNVSDIEPAFDELLKKAEQEIEEFLAEPGPLTFDNILGKFDVIGLELGYAFGLVSHLDSVKNSPELTTVYQKIIPRYSEFSSKIFVNESIWRRLYQYSETAEAKALTGSRKRYLDRTISEFKRHGAGLPDEKKTRLVAIQAELASITTRFAQNALDSTNQFEWIPESEDKLKGLPESALALGRELAKAKGLSGYRYNLQAPSVIAILTYLDDREIRERFYRAQMSVASKGEHDNLPLIRKILELRKEQAAIVGYQNFSDFVTANRMATNGDAAQSFINAMWNALQEPSKREHQELLGFIKGQGGPSPESLMPWDISYWVEKMRKMTLNFDAEKLRPYFSLPRVMESMFGLVQKIFGITVAPTSELPVWHPQVETYQLTDSDGGLLGYFYSDLFPREEKRGGAWMNHFISHRSSYPEDPPHVGLIAANFTPPTGDSPALLTHDEVSTLFHEFGHLLHHLLAKVPFFGQQMSSVPWDFIEFPSQIMENWCWEPEMLSTMAEHYKTGERLPEDLMKALLKSKIFRNGYFYSRQTGFARIDLKLHRDFDESRDGSIPEVARRIAQEHSPVPLPSDYSMLTNFTHLFSSSVGYAAGYYSYLWAETLEADAFSRFKNEGIFNAGTGKELREKVLELGDSEDPNRMFESFMGRKLREKSLLERAGLA